MDERTAAGESLLRSRDVGVSWKKPRPPGAVCRGGVRSRFVAPQFYRAAWCRCPSRMPGPGSVQASGSEL